MTSRLARKALRLSNIPAGSCLNLISKDISKFVAETPEEGQRFYPHQTERAEEGITISLGEVMGHGKRCAIVDILDNGPQVPRSAVSKFFEIDKQLHRVSLSQELQVYSDARLQRYQFSTTQPVESEEDLRPCMPRLIGLFGLARTESSQHLFLSDGTNRDIETICILLVERLPEHYHPLHKLRDILPVQDMSPPQNLFTAACRALRLLHISGYVHGDISRGNFLCTLEEFQDRERVFIIDFEKSRHPQDISFLAAVRGEMSALLRLFIEHGFQRDELTPLYNQQVALTLSQLSEQNQEG